jgi:superfamily II DNA/RNA helicase
MIFTRTKRTAQKVADDLTERGFAAAAVHGDLGQGAREQALRAFRAGKVDVLVATDVAARGIDVEGVTHVINYQCPEDEKTYVHRIGRTGRAGRTGVAITLVDWDETPRWKLIDTALNLGLAEPAETYSTSDHLFTDLGIPTDVTGRLPLGQRKRAGLSAEMEEDLTGGKPPRGRGNRRGGRPERSSGRSERASRPERAAEPAAGESTGAGRSRPRRRTRRGAGGGGSAGGDAPQQETRAEQAPADREQGERPAKRRRRRRGPGNSTGAGTGAGARAEASAERPADEG